jgi:hypothetical protein
LRPCGLGKSWSSSYLVIVKVRICSRRPWCARLKTGASVLFDRWIDGPRAGIKILWDRASLPTIWCPFPDRATSPDAPISKLPKLPSLLLVVSSILNASNSGRRNEALCSISVSRRELLPPSPVDL